MTGCYAFRMNSREKVTSLSDFRKNSSEQLTQLIAELANHNHDHGPGAQMGKSLARAFGSLIENGEDSFNIGKSQADTALESAQAARTNLGELTTKYEAVLARFGLTLNHSASESLRYGLPSGPLALRVTDARPFIRYLQSLKGTIESTETKAAFVELVKSVERQIKESDPEHPSPSTQSVIENIDEIIAALSHCASDIDTSLLSAYAQFQKTNRLQAYMQVDDAGLWRSPGEGFGPADWIVDISAEHLDKKWSDALSVLISQTALKEKGVAVELREHLLMCIEKSLEKLPTTSWNESTKDVFKEILLKFQSEIARVE